MSIHKFLSFEATAEVCGQLRRVSWDSVEGTLAVTGLQSFTEMSEVLERLSLGAVSLVSSSDLAAARVERGAEELRIATREFESGLRHGDIPAAAPITRPTNGKELRFTEGLMAATTAAALAQPPKAEAGPTSTPQPTPTKTTSAPIPAATPAPPASVAGKAAPALAASTSPSDADVDLVPPPKGQAGLTSTQRSTPTKPISVTTPEMKLVPSAAAEERIAPAIPTTSSLTPDAEDLTPFGRFTKFAEVVTEVQKRGATDYAAILGQLRRVKDIGDVCPVLDNVKDLGERFMTYATSKKIPGLPA